VTVITDDPANDQIPLTIKGRVVAIYTLSPKSVKLAGTVGEKIKETVRLVPGKEYPFTVKKVTAKRGKNIRFEFEEFKDGNTVEYELTVENTATGPEVYFDTLYLTTDSDIKPQIDISVVGRIKAAATDTVKKE
jgi:hypothetical protein